jgi:hypothetical protein
MMVAEIVGGIVFGSMALLADGWHMSTHAVAVAVAVSPISPRGVTPMIHVSRLGRESSASLPPLR